MKIDVCFSPALYPAYREPESIVVAVDIFRATTTIVTAFMNGAASIRPVASIDEAKVYKAKEWLVGAERNVRRCDFADFGNSPFDYTNERVGGKDIVLTTTNGTNVITLAKDASDIVAGAFINIDAVAKYCAVRKRNVTVLAAGCMGRVNIEDTLYGGALVDALAEYSYQPATDSALIAREMWQTHQSDIKAYIKQTEHYRRLLDNGLEADADYCLRLNTTDTVPILRKNGEVFVAK